MSYIQGLPLNYKKNSFNKEDKMFKNLKLSEVTLTDNEFAVRQGLVYQYLKAFDLARLTHTFRKQAGIHSEAKPLGGWESEDCGLRGHFVGHYLSACAKFAFAREDEELKGKVTMLVRIMADCIREDGYLSAFSEDDLDTLEKEEDRGVWAPYYTLHKILQGLIDSYVYLENKQGLDLAMRLANYIRIRFEKLSYWKIDGILRCTKVNPANEFGGIGESLYQLYQITQDSDILSLAQRFDRDYFIGNLAENHDVLENLHSNTHLPLILAASRRYCITGEDKFSVATNHFYRFLLGRTFANGNSSNKAVAFLAGQTSEKSEHWGVYNCLEDALTGGESESCCAHNTEKIVSQLFEKSGDVHYLNHLERLKYNAVLNAMSSHTGLSSYHQPLGIGEKKEFSTLDDSFWCCTGSGVEAMSELQKNIWFISDQSILWNTFISSDVSWKKQDVVLKAVSEFPDDTKASIIVSTKKSKLFTLLFKQNSVKRIWINGSEIDFDKQPNFIKIQRVFSDNDRVELELNAELHIEKLLGTENRGALLYGPVLLAQLGSEAFLGELTNEDVNQKVTRTIDECLCFSVSKKLLIPLYRVEDEVYSVYHYLQSSPKVNEMFVPVEDGRSAYDE